LLPIVSLKVSQIPKSRALTKCGGAMLIRAGA
jgi:hypothetical protein